MLHGGSVMPRAHRYFLPNHIWHITHRCHQRAFLLKFARDRRRWRQWLYEATAVDTEGYLARCLVYIDLNMVRAGAVAHPRDWDAGGYRELHAPPTRYAIIDRPALIELLGMKSLLQLQETHAQWIEEAIRAGRGPRDPMWTESLAVGRSEFVRDVQVAL